MKNIKHILIIIFLCGLVINSLSLMGTQVREIKRFGENQLMLPRQICLAGDEVYVLDEHGSMTSGDEKIKVFTVGGEFEMEFGRGGAGPGEYGEAIGIRVVSGKIYILDSLRRQIHIFSQKEKKFIESKRILSINASSTITTPSDFLITDDEKIYLNTARFFAGQKLIAKLVPVSSFELKVEKEFMNCIPLHNNSSRGKLRSSDKRNESNALRRRYLNKGYIVNLGSKIYFTKWLINKVYEFSLDGELLNQYTLPVQSIGKTVKINKIGGFLSLDHKLNYSLISDKNNLYVMSRDVNGDTLIFQLINDRFVEICKIKKMLFGGDISGTKLFAIGSDQSEIIIYDLKK